jgi:ubiquinone/menaquinone biosynthesis C-methylase UbiE/protein tyrosine phosphatase (PTP) superfamily phosphohydrolase (DUF442 family)
MLRNYWNLIGLCITVKLLAWPVAAEDNRERSCLPRAPISSDWTLNQALIVACISNLTSSALEAPQTSAQRQQETTDEQTSKRQVETKAGDAGPGDAEEGGAVGAIPAAVEEAAIGSTPNVHRAGELYFAGQFAAEDVAKIREQGFKRVITLRAPGEINWDEKRLIEEAGIEFIEVPFRDPESLDDRVFGRVRELLSDSSTKTLLHCGSANRVGGVWLPYRVLDEKVDLQTAVTEAERVGLKAELIKQKALAYIQRNRTGSRTSVKPGINDSFLDPNLDPAEFISRFEVESREIYSCRHEVVARCGIKPGMVIADVGSGTGLYTRLFAEATGGTGWVYGVDISPRLIEYVAKSKPKNVTCVLGNDEDITLPPVSLDLVFVCDTYHHFEYPQSTMASIARSLKPGGRLVLIDFERIDGVSSEFVIGHVRAGKEVFRAEIQDAGFALVEEVKISGFKENYFLVFRKTEGIRQTDH